MLKPAWLRQFLLGLFLLFDSYIGLNHGSGIIDLSGVLHIHSVFDGQLKWLVLSLEMMCGGLVLLRALLNHVKSEWKSLIVVLAPIIVALVGFGVLDSLLTGLGRSATINFNLASVTMSSLYWAAVYLSIAVGLTLTYKVQHFANFAQAEMMLVGSYVALTLMWSDRFFPVADSPKDGVLNWDLLIWASISAFLITGTIGLVTDTMVYKRLREKLGGPQVMMIASLGVSMILRAALFMRYSAGSFRFVPDRDWRLTSAIVDVPTERVQLHLGERAAGPLMEVATNVSSYGFAYSKMALVAGTFGSLLLLLILLHRTRLGRQMRAVADNPDLAASSGINVGMVHGMTAFLSAGTAGFGGALLAAILPINPELGLMLLLPAFAVVVLGTIGSIPGVIIGALIVGLLRAASEPILVGVGNALDRPTASGFAEVMPFVFLVGILLLAPKGIGSALESWNIERIRKRRSLNPGKNRSSVRIMKGPLGRLSQLQTAIVFTIEYLGQTKDKISGFLGIIIEYLWSVPLLCFGLLRPLIGVAIAPVAKLCVGVRVAINKRIRIATDTERGSWILFGVLLLLLLSVVWLLPSVTNLTKTLQVARIITLVGIFGLACFSLNLHTGITGMTNFGVIFFVGIGAVTVGLLSAPVATNGYGWNPIAATVVAVLISAVAGWLLAYPTARLRMDYFAIVTIALGEMLRISLQAEPLLRAGTVTNGIGISQYARPLEDWWENGPADNLGHLLGLPVEAPYVVVLAVLATISLILVWFLLNTLLASPWGRILRSIREGEIVSQHHGHNILTHKAASLALGAAVAALAGALWAWLNANVWPDFMNPVRTTFLIWAAFIVGGRGNNRGMVIGAFLIVIVEFVFNILVVSRGSASLPFHSAMAYLDAVFSWLVVTLGGFVWSVRSIAEIFPKGHVELSLPHLKLALIGVVIIVALRTSSRGLLPEVPSRPKRPKGLSTKVQEEQEVT
jgi:branched-chain amino acid transport system permease protein